MCMSPNGCISNNREDKLSVMQNLVTNLHTRKSKFDESSPEFCSQSERTKILKAVQRLDKKIDKIISQARTIFNPKFTNYDDAEIVFMIYMFSSAFSSIVPRVVDSRDLELICRNQPKAIINVLDSVKNGNLYQHIYQVEMSRGVGVSFYVRSFTILNDYLMTVK